MVAGEPPTRFISIHAPREGGDKCRDSLAHRLRLISIHAPREGGDLRHTVQNGFHAVFQSTPPARGATPSRRYTLLTPRLFQSTPPARGATKGLNTGAMTVLFQSTPPARGATALSSRCTKKPIFQSTPPARGATPSVTVYSSKDLEFQSTPPARGATWNAKQCRL